MMELYELPGADLILPGLEDLENGQSNSIGSFLISIASIRLRQAGLNVPEEHLHKEPELTLYRHLQQDRSDAYAYYNALLNTLNSFCLALEMQAKSGISKTSTDSMVFDRP